MRLPLDYSKDLRRRLADGKTLDEAFAELRSSGVSIIDCIASVRKLHGCSLGEAKILVESSSAWSDIQRATDDSFRVLERDWMTINHLDRNKSLQELEGQDWGEPNFESHLVQECHRLHRVPLCEFTVEDLRIMIGQRFSLKYLVPLALEQLLIDPMAEGAFYAGDLLASVLRAGRQFWQDHPDLRNEASAIAGQAVSSSPENKELKEAYDQFLEDQMTA
ncbi:MAG: hypothetical protein JWR26_4483 [Pedosphaera sp.]|nr:hypothetical protein [Pedosphaera sp.]